MATDDYTSIDLDQSTESLRTAYEVLLAEKFNADRNGQIITVPDSEAYRKHIANTQNLVENLVLALHAQSRDWPYLSRLATGITASTTQTQGQQPLAEPFNEVSTVANANDVCTFPTASAGLYIEVFNAGAETLQLFPSTGDDLGAGVNTSVTLASGSGGIWRAQDATTWRMIGAS